MTDPNDQLCRHLYQIRGADGFCVICRDTHGLIPSADERQRLFGAFDAMCRLASRPEPSISQEIAVEMARAMQKFPTWPTDPLHALAVLGEEFGELTKAVLQETYEPHKQDRDAVRKEAIQTAAMALRFAMSLDRYRAEPCEQHRQESP
jgi:NTP pyrophosphatase (non-canonical NTP hydrolase)